MLFQRVHSLGSPVLLTASYSSAKLKAFREFRREVLVQGELAGHKNLTELYGVCYTPFAMVIGTRAV